MFPHFANNLPISRSQTNTAHHNDIVSLFSSLLLVLPYVTTLGECRCEDRTLNYPLPAEMHVNIKLKSCVCNTVGGLCDFKFVATG